MTQLIRDVMTTNPRTLSADASAVDAAAVMKDHDIGDVLVVEDSGPVYGLVTDRDIIVRAVAQGVDTTRVRLSAICSADVTSVSPDDPIEVCSPWSGRGGSRCAMAAPVRWFWPTVR